MRGMFVDRIDDDGPDDDDDVDADDEDVAMVVPRPTLTSKWTP